MKYKPLLKLDKSSCVLFPTMVVVLTTFPVISMIETTTCSFPEMDGMDTFIICFAGLGYIDASRFKSDRFEIPVFILGEMVLILNTMI